jgi:hypothetical protein
MAGVYAAETHHGAWSDPVTLPIPKDGSTGAYTAPLDGGLIARKGTAVPAPAAPMACATTTAEQPREDSPRTAPLKEG